MLFLMLHPSRQSNPSLLMLTDYVLQKKQKKEENLFLSGKNSRKSRVTLGRTSSLQFNDRRFSDLQRLTVGKLFGQSPKSLVQADFGINAAQCPHRTQSPATVAMEVRHTTANQIFLNPVHGGPKSVPSSSGRRALSSVSASTGAFVNARIPQQHRMAGQV